ncbi:MAG: MATE family efflux transporter [Candidatus Rifleibacteriota bacterium]
MGQGRDLTEGSLLWNLVMMSVPIMFSNFIQVIYNLTDTYFLGQMSSGSKEAVAVTGLAFPLIFLFASLGQGVSVAITALVSRYKGRGEPLKIMHVLGQAWFMLVIFLIFLVLVAMFGISSILSLLHTPAEIAENSCQYLQFIMFGMVMMFIFFAFQSFAVGMGDTMSPMIINTLSVLINIVLDPILIYGMMGLPAMGVRGAGIATLIARIFTAVMAIAYMIGRYPDFLPKIKDFIPDWQSIKRILEIAVPASMAQTTTSLGFVVMQGLVNSFGTAVISANAIGNRFVNFIMMPPMGISNALAGIIGQNLGAGKLERAVKSFYVALGMSTCIVTIGSIVLYTRGNMLAAMFVNDPDVVILVSEMLKINSVAFWFFGFVFMFWGVFYGSGHSRPVMIVDIIRLWLVRLPMAYLLSGYFCDKASAWGGAVQSFLNYAASFLADKPYTSLWWPMIFSNISAVVMATIIYRKGTWLNFKEAD